MISDKKIHWSEVKGTDRWRTALDFNLRDFQIQLYVWPLVVKPSVDYFL